MILHVHAAALRVGVDGLLVQLFSLLEHCEDVELFGHVVSLLQTLCTRYNQQCKRVDRNYAGILQQKLQELDIDLIGKGI